MNILVLGSGGREHVLTWKMKQSPTCNKILVAPGNAGTASIAENLPISPEDFEAVKAAILTHDIHLVVIGPEAPLVAGIRDFLANDPQLKGIAIVGPDKKGSQLEGSKDFSKEFMHKYNIPTAAYKTFTKINLEEGLTYLEQCRMPIVLKADGLAAGKGVVICQELNEAKAELKAMLQDAKFGQASEKVVVEEFLDGIELSVFVLTDGQSYKILPEAKDYKRIGEGDTGLNTGGMGAVSPVSFADANFMEKVENLIIKPTLQGLKKESIDYKGFIFIGLMNVDGDPYVIEYNVRMGDPETQVVIPRIDSDLVELMLATHAGTLADKPLKIKQETHSTVVAVAGGYPGAYLKGKPIEGLKNAEEHALVFHAGTRMEEKHVLTNGGRVLAFTGIGNDLNEAINNAYQAAKSVCWEDIYYRKDIGRDLLELSKVED